MLALLVNKLQPYIFLLFLKSQHPDIFINGTVLVYYLDIYLAQGNSAD